uniref:Candidate secreted effector n=1 Tax=Meloidogyne incognita TaxID=6306 RepID=A0A914MS44_MELIC
MRGKKNTHTTHTDRKITDEDGQTKKTDEGQTRTKDGQNTDEGRTKHGRRTDKTRTKDGQNTDEDGQTKKTEKDRHGRRGKIFKNNPFLYHPSFDYATGKFN